MKITLPLKGKMISSTAKWSVSSCPNCTIILKTITFLEQSHQAVQTILCPACPSTGEDTFFCLPTSVV
jgi:hypothetical protein